MKKVVFVRFWSIAVGSMDALTGLLLLLAPGWVLHLLRVPSPSVDALNFLSWIGVFVLAVGLSYAMALGRRSRGETVWVFTSVVRALVAVFLTFKILGGSMSPAWGVVALADGAVAVVQVAVLRAGWWKVVVK
jgi:hypothetical protein